MRTLTAIGLNRFYYGAGLVFLLLAKTKSLLRGYRDAKPFATAEVERCIDYDLRVVDGWLRQLDRYTGGRGGVVGKSILEIGPGADLGVGLYLLAIGASRYTAFDKHGLAASVPELFYDRLFERVHKLQPAANMAALRAALSATATDTQPEGQQPLRYLVRNDFDIAAAVAERSVDIVFSNAAFEHIEDVAKAVRQLTRVMKPGGMLIAEVDLRTHSRWIRDQDPNNIYRYDDRLYRLFRFSGIPNRVRPQQYRQYFTANGWIDVDISSNWVLPPELSARNAYLSARFRGDDNQMDYLTIILCATRPAA